MGPGSDGYGFDDFNDYGFDDHGIFLFGFDLDLEGAFFPRHDLYIC